MPSIETLGTEPDDLERAHDGRAAHSHDGRAAHCVVRPVMPADPAEAGPAEGPLAPVPCPPGTTPQAFAARIVGRSGSSFSWAMRSLSSARREAIHAVYAFCRIVDDIADDDALDRATKRDLLDAWSAEIEALYADRPRSAVGRALLAPIAAFDLPRAEFDHMIDGMMMDVDGPVVAPSFATLHAYTRRVAGSVGMLAIRIFGVPAGDDRDRFALALADALQLTNILRDVEEDAGLGRVYLPRELLERHGIVGAQALDGAGKRALVETLRGDHPELPKVRAALAAAALDAFAEARDARRSLGRTGLRPALMMMGVYETYLHRMEATGHVRPAERTAMSRGHKLLVGLRYAYAFPERPATAQGAGSVRAGTVDRKDASGTVHVVGAGLAGLSTALRLAEAGRAVRLHEATAQAGGRCRSFHDARLGCRIDNGNHLVLSGNRSAMAYARATGGAERLRFAPPDFPFVDLANGQRWRVRLSRGPLQWRLLSGRRGLPDARRLDWFRALRLPLAGPSATVADVFGTEGTVFRRFWEPMTWAVLNTTPERASARLLWCVFAETFARGAASCRVVSPVNGWGHALIDPALDRLAELGVKARFDRPLERIVSDGCGRATALDFAGERVTLGPRDGVVLALPRARVADLLPELDLPDGDATIVNAHFRLDEPPRTVSGAKVPPMIGLVGAKTHWVFVHESDGATVLSVTISAADALGLERATPEELLPVLWKEVVLALELAPGTRHRAARLVRERRATFDQSPASVARRPGPRVGGEGAVGGNLYLAGDWTDTGLPATIEGAIRSGENAAQAVLWASTRAETVQSTTEPR